MAQRCVLDGHGGRAEDQGTNDADDPFGTTTATTAGVPNPFQFTGRENDGLAGLYYYRARYYDPALSRFIAEDPLRLVGGNLYGYVENSPLRFRDAFGLERCSRQLRCRSARPPQVPRSTSRLRHPVGLPKASLRTGAWVYGVPRSKRQRRCWY